ncbi:hypothetical protein [uncultured Methanobrevibacter sp.]|nr:hypothetical protein [uncultured Methanobrevibacter sp.]
MNCTGYPPEYNIESLLIMSPEEIWLESVLSTYDEDNDSYTYFIGGDI